MSSVFNYFYFCRIRVVGIRIFEMSRQYDFMLRRFSAIILINNLNVMKDLQFFLGQYRCTSAGAYSVLKYIMNLVIVYLLCNDSVTCSEIQYNSGLDIVFLLHYAAAVKSCDPIRGLHKSPPNK